MKNIIKNIWKIINYPLLYLVLQFIISSGYTFVMAMILTVKLAFENAMVDKYLSSPEVEIFEILQSPVHVIVPLIISIFITLILIFGILGREWKSDKFWSFAEIKSSPLILCFTLGAAFNIFTIGVFALLPITPQQRIDNIIGSNLILDLISFALLAALLEEVIFRGIVLKRLTKMMKLPVAVILQALIFAVIHLDLVQGTYSFVIGLILGLVYIWFDSIWLVISLHFAFNATSIVLSHILGETEIYLLYFIIVAFIISGVSLFVLYKKRIKTFGGEQ